jgi:hypothetical protein
VCQRLNIPHGKTVSGGGVKFDATPCAARVVFFHTNDSKVISSNAMRAADAVAPNLAYPPEKLLPTTDFEPLARSKCCRRPRGAPPAAVMLAAGAVFLSCCRCVRSTVL